MITIVLSKYLISRTLVVQLIRRVNQFHLRTMLGTMSSPWSSPHSFRRFSTVHDDFFEIDASKSSYSVKDVLYPKSSDTTIQAINSCGSMDEFAKFVDNVSKLNKPQLCQLVVMLGDHVKLLGKPLVKTDTILLCLSQLMDEMSIKEQSCCFHYLHKIGVNIRHPVMAAFTDTIIQQTHLSKEHPLEYLSHFTVGLSSDKGLYSTMVAAATMPQVTRMLDDCQTGHDLYILTICLGNISHVLSVDKLIRFKSKVEEFLDKGLLNEASPKAMLKIINFLNYPHWSFRNTSLIRKLLLELEDNIRYLETKTLVSINRAFHSQLESARIIPLLVKRAQELLEQEPCSVELLPLAVLEVTPDQRCRIAEKLRKFLLANKISSMHTSDTLQTVFKILRLLKISDVDMSDNLWTKVLNEVYSATEPSLIYSLSKYVYKYMFFNNNLGGTYRHLEFESSMMPMLMAELKSTVIPKDFAMFASFIIAYGDVSGKKKIPQFIVDKIEKLNEQFSIKDCMQLSRGVQILLEMRRHQTFSVALQEQLTFINASLGKCAERQLNTKSLHLSELNAIIRAFNSRKASRDCSLFHSMINRYNTIEKLELNSRIIKDITLNLTNCNFRMDNVFEQLVDYTLVNWDHMTGDTVEKILTCCYNFSYFPDKLDFFDRCSEIIVRDFNYMSGLSIVQALLALVFYKACPLQLISVVFSSEFLSRVEQEIAMCYSKNIYPQRVMNEVMKLNRAVCLDCPEVNVRWFQQSFVEAQASKVPVIRSRLHSDVKNILLSFVESPEYLRIDWVTPYGYRVDFELNTDQYNRFVRPPSEDYHHVNYLPHINKIAVLILSNKMFCDNDINRLKGAELLRLRHLEMLGYRVIHVKAHDFNRLFKNFAAKIKYLKNLLQLTT